MRKLPFKTVEELGTSTRVTSQRDTNCLQTDRQVGSGH